MSKRVPLGVKISVALMLGMPAGAQAIAVHGLLQAWATQMLDSNLRQNTLALPYYNLRPEFRENTFALRRSELHLKATLSSRTYAYVVIDPTQPTLLVNAFVHIAGPQGYEFQFGQFRAFQTREGTIPSTDLLFAERSQLARVFGDVGERGAAISRSFPAGRGWGGTARVGIFNGSGKSDDANAQKDVVARVEFSRDGNLVGAYGLVGSTNLRDTGQLRAATFPGVSPGADTVVLAKDRTTNLGVFAEHQNGSWLLSFEAITGLLGRRFPSLYLPSAGGMTVPAVQREHLDQRFFGAVLTGGYRVGSHTFLIRLDRMDYNWGNRWYPGPSPYQRITPEGPVDVRPVYRETTVGYLYAFDPATFQTANLKINYIFRGRSFLLPRAEQSGTQSGDSLVACFQVSF